MILWMLSRFGGDTKVSTRHGSLVEPFKSFPAFQSPRSLFFQFGESPGFERHARFLSDKNLCNRQRGWTVPVVRLP